MVGSRLLLICLLAINAGSAHAQSVIPESQAKLELIIDRRDHPPLQREMVLATLRGTYTVEITLEKISLPRMRDLEWVQLDHDNWRATTEDGRSVRVMERRLALFPLRAGSLTIKPAVQQMTVLSPAGERKNVTVTAKPVTLEVQQSPAAGSDWWLPARAVELTDEWSKDPAQLADGESVIRTVTLSALGATEQMLPPQPRMREPWLITFVDAEKRGMALSPAGPLARVVWRWTLRPITGEPGVIPQVTIPWFDTQERLPKAVTLKAQPFGYSGFGANTVSRWQSGFSGVTFAGLAFIIGLAVPLFVVSLRGRFRTFSELAAPLRRLLPPKDILELRRAARQNSYHAVRQAARAISSGAPERFRPELEALIAGLDHEQYGRMAEARPSNARAFAKEFEQKLRRHKIAAQSRA